MNQEFIQKVKKLVDSEYQWDEVENDDYGTLVKNCKDSFGDFTLTSHCEPEDAIWGRDLQDNFWTGLKVGVRNTLKVLKDNPELLKGLKVV